MTSKVGSTLLFYVYSGLLLVSRPSFELRATYLEGEMRFQSLPSTSTDTSVGRSAPDRTHQLNSGPKIEATIKLNIFS
jgi:hypothetical protein